MSQEITWHQHNEKEFQIGENKILILDNSIIYIEVIGEQTDKHAEIIKLVYKKIYEQFTGKIKQLVNLNRSGKSSKMARDVFKEINEHELTDKVAVYGIHPVARVLAAFVIGITNENNIRFFANKEEALFWLVNG